MVTTARPPAVAGRFYTDDAAALRRQVTGFLREGFLREGLSPSASIEPRQVAMLIAPHAGYDFSGPIAGSAFACWSGQERLRQRVVVIGPSHYHRFYGIALPSATAFDTPLGRVQVDAELVAAVRGLPGVLVEDPAHVKEHSLEVELPFLQVLWGDAFTLLPLVVGWADSEQVAAVLEAAWRVDPELRVVVSTDLSHFLSYDEACRTDRATVDSILAFDHDLHPRQACGAYALNGALPWARRHGFEPHLLDLRNSGDTYGDREQVVGYAAVSFRAAAFQGDPL